jgi:hypothetical protein
MKAGVYDASMSRQEYTSVRVNRKVHKALVTKAKKERRTVIATLEVMLGL